MDVLARTFILFYFILFGNSINCLGQISQNKFERVAEKTIKLNDSAVVLKMKIISNEISNDSILKVIKLLKESIKSNPSYKIAYINLWDTFNYTRQFKESIQLCSDWLRIYPEDIEVYLKRGMLYEHIGEINLSNKDYEIVQKKTAKTKSPKITANLNNTEITGIIRKNYMDLVINKINIDDFRVKLLLMKSYFPTNVSIANAYKSIEKKSRIEYINSMLGLL